MALGLTVLGGTPALAEPLPVTKVVTYRGHQLTVPDAWKVVDLGKNPAACVRFDQHTVYLGHPSADQDCPSRVLGRTEALLVEPAANPPDRLGIQAKPRDGEYRADAADVSITATYDKDAALIRTILTGADLDVPTVASRVRETARPLAAVATVPANATNYTGKGFDTCAAPSSGAMDAWKASSPYSAVGIYIGGSQRGCSQPNLTASWVRQQADNGWRFLPLYVGPQAAAITSPANQGISAANGAISDAAALGFGPGSTLYYDMESYASSLSSRVLSFESAWTDQLHARGYHSGIYSSSSSGIKDLVDHGGGYTMPDVIFDALWNGVADTADPVVPGARWSDHQRVHQYAGGHSETWGGTTINIDKDYLDVQLATGTATPHGRVWDRSRPDGGPWDTNATLIDSNDAVNSAVAAGLPDGTVHVETLVNGEIWDRTRSASGAWSTAAMIDVGGAVTDISSAALPDGTLHVQAVVNGEVWDRTRATNGTWTGSTQIDAGGAVTDVSSAALPDGTLHVQAVTNGEVWDRTRTANGTWTGSTQIDAGGAVTDVSSAALPDGTLHVQAVTNGEVWDRTRTAAGIWSGSTRIDANGSIFGTYAAATPNGTLHIGTNA